MMFIGFPEATIQFFLDIRFHNSIDYFLSLIHISEPTRH